MPIPDYQAVMLSLLKYVSDGREHSLRETIDAMADAFGMSDEERRELLPSGRQAIIDNRVGWARTYLKKAGLVEATRRSHFKITERGRDALARKPERIDVNFLMEYPEFREFRAIRKDKSNAEQMVSEADETPEELMERAYQSISGDLADELVQQVKTCSPPMFERMVVELLLKMGYGGSRKDAGEAIGKSGDEGIDGIIKEDRLGLDIIYLQAKRWENPVGRPEIQKFAGALDGKRAQKGIFITTSSFSREAIEYVSQINKKIILIDGNALASHMIDHDLGVTPVSSYEIKRIDGDYFSEE
jgi:restriction system protein